MKTAISPTPRITSREDGTTAGESHLEKEKEFTRRGRRSVPLYAGAGSSVVLLLIPKCLGCVGAYLALGSGVAWGGRDYCGSSLNGMRSWFNLTYLHGSVATAGFACVLLFVGGAFFVFGTFVLFRPAHGRKFNHIK